MEQPTPNENEQQLTCSICLTVFDKNELHVSTTLCSHIFHENCLNEWLKNHKTCPNCRTDVGEILPSFLAKESVRQVNNISLISINTISEMHANRIFYKKGLDIIYKIPRSNFVIGIIANNYEHERIVSNFRNVERGLFKAGTIRK